MTLNEGHETCHKVRKYESNYATQTCQVMMTSYVQIFNELN